MLRGFRRGVLGLAIGLLVLSPLVATMTPMVASAAKDNPLDQLQRWFYYRGMRACFNNPDFDTRVAGIGDNNTVDVKDINEGHIFTSFADGKGFGYLAPDMDDGNDNDGTVSCSDGSIFVRGASLFGFSNTLDLVCEMNRALSSNDGGRIKPSHPTDCEKSDKVEFDGGGGDVFQRALTKALETGGSKDRPPFNINDNSGPEYSYKALLYLIGKESLETFCGNGVSLADGAADGGSIDDGDVVSVDIVNSDGTVKASQPYPIANSDRDENSSVTDIYYNQGGDANNAQDLKCHEMAALTRDNSSAYKDWVALNKDEAEQNENPTNGGSDPETGGTTETTSCAIDGIGWIICPVMAFIGKMNDAAYGFLRNILAIQPGLINSQSTQNAWAAFRDIANVAFVIAFMIIVYSQLTSAGITNYGVKKMLPRIVIAAILVNISFIICAIAVDVSNIVGSSIYSLLKDSIDVGSEIEADAWGNSIDGILKGAAIGVGVVLLVVALAMAPMALLAFLVIILIIVARQALVILLVVVAPLAFVAYLLPNTEDWFKKWWKALTVALMVYPIVGAVFGASTLASRVLTEVAQGGDENQELLLLIALGVLAVPLFAVPAILKGSLSAAGSIGTKLAGLADRSTRASNNQFSNRAKQMGGGIRDAATTRALNGEGFLGRRGVGSLIRARARRNEKYNSLSEQAKAAADGFGSTDEKASGYRRAAIQSQQTAGILQGMNKAAAEVDHMDVNTDLHVRGKISEMELEGAKAAQGALVKEISSGSIAGMASGAGAGLNVADMERAHEAHEQIEIQGKRANSAARIAQEELAGRIRDQSSGLAIQAAGIGDAPAMSRVIGEATQIEFKAFDDAVSAEQTTMTNLKGVSADPNEPDLLKIVKDPNQSNERRAAAAGMIMKNGGMNEIHQLIDTVQTMGATGEASDIRKQMMGDMNRTPFGMGAGDIAAFKRGEAAVDPSSNTAKSYTAMMEARAQKKLSDSKWAGLDPDDQSRFSAIATSGQLSTASLQNLVNATQAAEINENISVTDEAKAHGAAIRAYAATLGIVPTP